jgi:hypothetical protein
MSCSDVLFKAPDGTLKVLAVGKERAFRRTDVEEGRQGKGRRLFVNAAIRPFEFHRTLLESATLAR